MTHMQAWPVGDHDWVRKYRTAMVGRHVPAPSLQQRERDLLDAVLEMQTSADELFGNPEELAAEDAVDLATADETVRTSLGGGLQPALKEVGDVLTGIGAVSALLVFIRSGWSVDINTGRALVAAGVLVLFVGWVVSRAFFSAGRAVVAAGALGVAGALALAAIATAAAVGRGPVVANDVPTPLLALAMVVPGVGLLVLASRTPRPLRDDWDDATWLRRFRGGLRARLVPSATAHDHVAEIEQALTAGGSSAHAEYGHPLALAREVAAADRSARTRLWVISTLAKTGTPATLAALILVDQSWGSMTIPVAVALALIAASTLRFSWSSRPWATRP